MLKKLFKKKEIVDYHYVVAKEKPISFTTETLQKALVNLEYVNIDKKYKVIQFTSTIATEGKTTMISNFAYLMAQRKKKVLVIDLDLRKPKMHKVFDVANENGINDYLLGSIELSEAIKYSEEFKVDYLLSGEKTTAVVNVLTAEKLKKLIEELKEQYDYILIDSPPVLVVSDALYIANLVDGIIFNIAQNKARKKDVREALTSLEKTNTPIIGTLLTQVELSGKAYDYTYKYQYIENND